MKEYSTVVWDFNGTLIDDVMASLEAVNDMLIRRSQPTIDLDRYYKEIDIPIWNFYKNVFLEGTITPEEAMAEYDSGYEAHLLPNPIMAGVVDILDYLKLLGKRQIVVSASNVNKVKSRLKDFDILSYFDTVLAHSDYNAGDKTYLAKQYFLENNISPQDAVIIGDSIFDFKMASDLGCDCILNTKGHQSRREFSVTTAQIIDDLIELKNIIR